MGYATTFPLSDFDFQCGNYDGIGTITSVAATIAFSQVIDLPAWSDGTIKHAYLVMSISGEQNTSAAGANWTLTDQTIQIEVGGLWKDAILIPSASIMIEASTSDSQHLLFIGTYDLQPYGLVSGTTYAIRWLNARSLRDNLIIKNPQFFLRVMMER